MRYFTRKLWLSAQDAGQLKQYDVNWQQASGKYFAQLKTLESRVSADTYRFFAEADVHDGELLALVVKDGSRPAPLRKPVRPWKPTKKHPVSAELTVLDSYDKFVWKLSYVCLRRVVVDFPTDNPLFYGEGEGFGDWGYHELTDAGNGFLRHEILFASGAVLLFEFKSVAASCLPPPSTRADQRPKRHR